MKDFYGGTSNINSWKSELSAVKPAPAPEFVPLASHWTITGACVRREDREAYKAIPSAYSPRSGQL